MKTNIKGYPKILGSKAKIGSFPKFLGCLFLVWTCFQLIKKKVFTNYHDVSHRISEKRLTHNPKNKVFWVLWIPQNFQWVSHKKRMSRTQLCGQNLCTSTTNLLETNNPPPIKIPKKPQHNPTKSPSTCLSFPVYILVSCCFFWAFPTVSFTASLATRPAPATKSSARAILRSILKIHQFLGGLSTPPWEQRKNVGPQKLLGRCYLSRNVDHTFFQAVSWLGLGGVRWVALFF